MDGSGDGIILRYGINEAQWGKEYTAIDERFVVGCLAEGDAVD